MLPHIHMVLYACNNNSRKYVHFLFSRRLQINTIPVATKSQSELHITARFEANTHYYVQYFWVKNKSVIYLVLISNLLHLVEYPITYSVRCLAIVHIANTIRLAVIWRWPNIHLSHSDTWKYRWHTDIHCLARLRTISYFGHKLRSLVIMIHLYIFCEFTSAFVDSKASYLVCISTKPCTANPCIDKPPLNALKKLSNGHEPSVVPILASMRENIQSSAVITRSNLSRYYIRHCDNSGRKWIRY